jgi:hypothetical protein
MALSQASLSGVISAGGFTFDKGAISDMMEASGQSTSDVPSTYVRVMLDIFT